MRERIIESFIDNSQNLHQKYALKTFSLPKITLLKNKYMIGFMELLKAYYYILETTSSDDDENLNICFIIQK